MQYARTISYAGQTALAVLICEVALYSFGVKLWSMGHIFVVSLKQNNSDTERSSSFKPANDEGVSTTTVNRSLTCILLIP